MNRTPLALLLSTLFAIPTLSAQEPIKLIRHSPATAATSPQDPQPAAKAPAVIYDEAADAEQLVAAAMAIAARDNKRVLLMYGGNWCSWCHKLDGTLKSDKDLRTKMRDEYELVHVDIGRGEKHAELAARFGSEHKKHGYPYLTVIDGAGNTIAHKDTAELEAGAVHDPVLVMAFLEACQAPPVDAGQVLTDAQAAAKADGKLLFVHIGAPWCGWCHRLEDWMARPEIAAVLQREFVDVKIDQDRMTNGMLVATLLRQGKGGGIPWFVFMNDGLQPLVNSDGPKGNVGFPAQPEEIEHFVAMLKQVKNHLTDEDIAGLAASLQPK